MKIDDIYLITEDHQYCCEHNFLTTLDAIQSEYPNPKICGNEITYGDQENVLYFGEKCTCLDDLISWVLCVTNEEWVLQWFIDTDADWEDWTEWYCDFDLAKCDKRVLDALPKIMEESSWDTVLAEKSAIDKAFAALNLYGRKNFVPKNFPIRSLLPYRE